jgi:Ca2+-transporting ATPase
MAAATLGVIAGAEHSHGDDLARTMGLSTFALANLFFSFTARDELRSVFSLETFNDRRFLITSLMSRGATVRARRSLTWSPSRRRPRVSMPHDKARERV